MPIKSVRLPLFGNKEAPWRQQLSRSGAQGKKRVFLENSEPLEAAMEAAIKKRKHYNSHPEQVLCFGS
jgi:hypothetical protein